MHTGFDIYNTTVSYENYGRFDSTNLRWWVVYFSVFCNANHFWNTFDMYSIIKFCSPFSLEFCNMFLRSAISYCCLVVLSEEKWIFDHFVEFFKIFCAHRIVNTSDCSARRIFMGSGLSWIIDFVLPRRDNLKLSIFSFKLVKIYLIFCRIRLPIYHME